MRSRFTTAAAILLALALNLHADDKDERAKFNGKWVASELTFGGMKVPAETLKNIPWYWTIDEKGIHSKRPGSGGKTIHEEEIEFAFDTTKTPKSFDLTDPRKKATNKGIYKLDADTLTICFALKPDGKRPDDFAAGAGSERMLMVWTRVKN